MSDSTSVAALVWMVDGQPKECKGWLAQISSDQITMVPAPNETLPEAQTSVVVCIEDVDRTKWIGTVLTTSYDAIQVALADVQPRFRRYYPRADTLVAMAWRVLDLGPKAGDFSKNQIRALKQWWRPASALVNLSNDGLSFLSSPHLPMGARVQVKLRLSQEQEEHSLVAEVVRSARELVPGSVLSAADSSGEVHEDEEFSRIALHFPSIPAGTREAISRYMQTWQEDILETLAPATNAATDPKAHA